MTHWTVLAADFLPLAFAVRLGSVAVSLALDPSPTKNTRAVSHGATDFSFSASSIAGPWLRLWNRWLNASFSICAVAALTSSFSP